MPEAIRVLHIEDSADDAELVLRVLQRAGFEVSCRRVETRAELERALREGPWDVVLSDFRLPGFDGLAALDMVRDCLPDLPVILVTGSLGEERAVEVMRRGAADMVLKERLDRLGEVVRREIHAAAQRRLRQDEAIRRQAAEDAARESAERFRNLFEESAIGMVQLDAGGRVLEANPAFAGLLGYALEDLRSRPITELTHPEDTATTHRAMRELQSRERGAITFEKRYLTREGRAVWAHVSASALRDAAGAVTGFLGVIEDITRSRNLEDQLRQAQKMEAVGRLAGGVAHDFNNLLSIINGYAEMAFEALPPEAPERGQLAEVLAAGKRAAALTRQLLAFSRKQVVQMQPVDLGQTVKNLEKMLRRLIGEEIRIETQIAPGLPPVLGDAGQMDQVLMNLAVNARDAMPKGGTLTIRVATEEVGEDEAAFRSGAKPGPHVTLTVTDTGVGMGPEVLSHLFEPFFTTKEHGKGSGLGLSVVYGIVRQSGGHILVESAPGKGATFRIRLPVAPEAAAAAPAPPSRVAAAVGRETILVLEDEEPLRRLVVQALRMKGYTVLEAGSGEAALGVERGHTGPIHLLLADTVMPGMSGPEAAGALAARRPEMRTMFMSGYTEHSKLTPELRASEVPFMQKPFSPKELLQKVREVLDQNREGVLAPDR